MANLIPDDIEVMHSVKIDYVSEKVDKREMEDLFGKYGKVGDVYMPSHPNGDRKGFAFVRYYNKKYAEEAVREMDGAALAGKTLKCMMASVNKGKFNPNTRKGPRSRSRDRDDEDRDRAPRRRDDSRRPPPRQRYDSRQPVRQRYQSPRRGGRSSRNDDSREPPPPRRRRDDSRRRR
eukprot:TRINITY_DN107612_c0_g1_i1.p1 TRINITY_DN107612_c0_g1~~TRINITY_DN107612_c0_g1_i1.p1  ORF type:complete len:177 (-),score=21.14 TRINITY_DN107612_c0_g1_i1:46-576(-)